MAPLRKIRDSHEKITIALDGDTTRTGDGIKIVKTIDYLLEREQTARNKAASAGQNSA